MGLFAQSTVALQIYKGGGHCLLTNAAFRRLFGSEPPPEYNVLHDDQQLANQVFEAEDRVVGQFE